MNVRFYLSYDIKITSKLYFCSENVKIFSLCTQHFFYLITCNKILIYGFITLSFDLVF